MRPDQMPRQPFPDDDDLSLLPEEVREALRRLYSDANEELCGDTQDGVLQDLDRVRAELLRLTKLVVDMTFTDDSALRRANERANAQKERADKFNAGASDYAHSANKERLRAERAEAERDALRKRIDFAPTGIYKNGIADQGTVYTYHFATQNLIGKRVALVPLDDAEAKG